MKTGNIYTLLALTKVTSYRMGAAQPLQSLSMSTHAYTKSSKTSKAYKTFTAIAKSNKQFKTPSRSRCVDQTVQEFIIDDSEDIGDVLLHNGPGFTSKCAQSDCYTLKDNGDDPPYDPELGDTLRFAYKQITSDSFSLSSRVCGVACDGEDKAGIPLYFGRVGLMVRDSLDPFARNIFVSHSPMGQAEYSYRNVTGGDTFEDFDGSPDVECLWITLVRDNRNTFSASYAYEGIDSCDRNEIPYPNLSFSIDNIIRRYLLVWLYPQGSPHHTVHIPKLTLMILSVEDATRGLDYYCVLF